MSKFKIGDKVSVLDDNLRGKVVHIGAAITVHMEDGFELEFSPNELVREMGTDAFEINATPGINDLKAKAQKSKTKKRKLKAKQRNEPELVIDLHIEQLVKSTKDLSSFDMLTKQLDTAKYHINLALSKRIRKLVFIHGVGDGVLRADLEALFRQYEDFKYYDADYRKYGQGAVEVYIPQSAFN